MKQSIPFNRPPFFQDSFTRAIKNASDAGKFSGDGINTKDCTDFLKLKYGYDRSLLTPSCTAALEMSALILDLGPGDEVIVPSFTFVTSANAFALRGVTIVFADCEKGSPNVSVSDILNKVTKKTKAIVVVHYAGIPVDVQRILKETNSTIPVVEDCAHAIGSIDPKTGDFIGKSGCLSTFSFHETKNIGIGEGGLLVVNDEKLWTKAQVIREKGTNRTEFQKGNVSFYTWVGLGSSYLMSDIDAAMLWSALQHIDSIQERRLGIWDAYHREIIPNSLFKRTKENLRANAHMYYLEFKDPIMREEFCKVMKDAGIVVAKHYVSLHTSPFARNAATYDRQVSCPQADKWTKTLVRLPLFYDLTADKVKQVISAVNTFATNNGTLLCPASENHWEDIRQIRNNNAKSFRNTHEIGKEEHWDFMRKHHHNYRVATQNGKCVGFIGQVVKDIRLVTSKKGTGVSYFLADMWLEELGDKWDVWCLRTNKRLIGFARRYGFFPVKKIWEAGDNPIKLERPSEEGTELMDVLGSSLRSKL